MSSNINISVDIHKDYPLMNLFLLCVTVIPEIIS